MLLEKTNISWLVIAGTAGMLIMVFAIISFIIIHQRRVIRLQMYIQQEKDDQQTMLMHAAVQSGETERQHISSDLRDEVGALLSTIKLYLNQIRQNDLNDARKMSTITNCKELLDETISTVRDISVKLQPSTIEDFGLEATMEIFCNKINTSSAMYASLTVQGSLQRLDQEKELAIFRIIQELTDNIMKHACAQTINYLMIQKDDNVLQVFMEHDGNGISQEEFLDKLYSSQGLGLKNIQNRINILKGDIQFDKGNNNMDTIFVQFHFPV